MAGCPDQDNQPRKRHPRYRGSLPASESDTRSSTIEDSIVAAGDDTYFIIEGDGEDGPKVTVTAGNHVDLKDGFHAQEGCYFRASTDFWPDGANPMLSTADRAEKAVKDIVQAVDKKAINEAKEIIPKVFSCAQNYPNPFMSSTTIKYGLPKNCDNVNLTIFNIAGQAVKTLVNGSETAGFKQVRWDGKNSVGMQVPKGVYFYVFKADDFERHHKMILLK